MRLFLAFVPTLMLAQVPAGQAPAAKSPAAAPKPAAAAKPPAAAPKPAVAPKPGVAPVRPAGAKPVVGAKPAAPAKPKPAALTTDDEKIIYAVGLSMFKSLSQFDLSTAELDLLKRALTDAAAGNPAVEINEWGPKIQGLLQTRSLRTAEREKAASQAYLAKAAGEPGAVKTESGLVFRDVTVGTGASPKATDTVKVHYQGTLTNGTEFDSSYKRNEPAQFALNQVIRCWTEGLQKMKTGGKAILVCPSDIAYGDRGRPSIPGGATLVFQVELLDIVAAANP